MRRSLPTASNSAEAAEAGQLAPIDRRVLVVAGAVFVVLMALSDLYGSSSTAPGTYREDM
jgi:hypothetical protein